MQKHPFSFSVVATLAVGVVVSPLASYALLGSVTAQHQVNPFAVQAQVRRGAMGDRDALRQQQRAHKLAIDDCLNQRRVTGEEVPCADVNDASSYEDFTRALQGNVDQVVPTSSIRRRIEALAPRDRALVEQAAANGECSLRLVGQGLYRYCELLRIELGQDATVFGGFQNDRAAQSVREGQSRTSILRARIQQVQDAMHGSAPEGRGDYRLR